MHQDPTSLSDYVALNSCQDLPPVSVMTPVAPVGEHQTLYAVVGGGQVGVDPDDHVALVGEPPTLYVTTSDRLYAVHAGDGTVRWCQQVQPTQELIQKWSARPGMRHLPPPSLTFGAPRVANGVVYVCVSGYGRYTCAFNAGDGSLRWRTPTDAWSVSIPFGDYAVPVVREGIVYNGTYALNVQDGTVLWRCHPQGEYLCQFTRSAPLRAGEAHRESALEVHICPLGHSHYCRQRRVHQHSWSLCAQQCGWHAPLA